MWESGHGGRRRCAALLPSGLAAGTVGPAQGLRATQTRPRTLCATLKDGPLNLTNIVHLSIFTCCRCLVQVRRELGRPCPTVPSALRLRAFAAGHAPTSATTITHTAVLLHPSLALRCSTTSTLVQTRVS